MQRLTAAAKSRSCPFDCLLVDDTSRLARNIADSFRLIDTLKFRGIGVISVSRGFDSDQSSARPMLALHGIMDEQYLVGLAQKVHRGQEGLVRQGMTTGGRCYGYRNVPIEDPTRKGKHGRPAVLGVLAEVVEEEAVVVRRIFKMSAAGDGYVAIAITLNQEGIAGPRGPWSKDMIREMLRNEKYRGVVIWNRRKRVLNPETGRKTMQPRPESEWIRVETPKLRIVTDELWEAVHRRLKKVNRDGALRAGGMSRAKKTYLFSGMLRCGCCGANLIVCAGGGKRGYVKYGCGAHKRQGACTNNHFIRQDRLEDQLLSAIEDRVFKPAVIQQVVARCEREVRRRLKEMEQRGSVDAIQRLRRNHERLKLKASRLTHALEEGGAITTLVNRLKALEAEMVEIDRAIAAQSVSKPKITTDQIRESVLRNLMRVREMLDSQEVLLAKSALRKHLGELSLTPTVVDGKRVFEVSGNSSLTGERDEGVMQGS